MTQRLQKIPTLPGMGRSLIEHDEASKMFRATALLPSDTTQPRTKTWRRGGAYDQGQTSECVANTGKGILNTLPLSHNVDYDIRSQYRTHEFYKGAQLNDEWPGENYDGTSALGLCKYFKQLGLISEYRWCFGLQDVLRMISYYGPVGIGIWWTQDMFQPDARGFIYPTGGNAGGHEVELIGVDLDDHSVIGMNSWGDQWGDRGRFKMKWDDLDNRLSDQGDAFTIVR